MQEAFECPACGEEVPAGSLSCPHCGADEKAGWNTDSTRYDGLDLPDDDFDYDRFVKEEFNTSSKPLGISTLMWVAGIVMIIALFLVILWI